MMESDDFENEPLSDIELITLERAHACLQNLPAPSSTGSNEVGELFCPRTFDGWTCWGDTPAGQISYQPCPFFITGFNPKRFAHKECLPDGTWYRHPESNKIWSNYTTCVDLEMLHSSDTLLNIQQVGYVISLCALLISLIIFSCFRSLECARVRIHQQLFISFVFHIIFWLIWVRVLIHPGLAEDQSIAIWCSPVHVLLNYFLLATYFWVFIEGFHTHAVMVSPFSSLQSETKYMWRYTLFGWLGPSIPVGLYAYAYLRLMGPTSSPCMILNSNWHFLMIVVPAGVSLLISSAFVINILRILLTSSSTTSDKISETTGLKIGTTADYVVLKKATRGTLMLIPLLGLNYLLIIFRLENVWDVQFIYYFSTISFSLQGFFVSLLLCFTNEAVIAALRRKFCDTNGGI